MVEPCIAQRLSDTAQPVSSFPSILISNRSFFQPFSFPTILISYHLIILGPGVCARCNVTANPCIASVECTAGKCSPVVPEADGTPCVITDWQAHTVSGFCVRGNCDSSLTASFYNQRQNRSIWQPANGLPGRHLQVLPADYMDENVTAADDAVEELPDYNVTVGVAIWDDGTIVAEGMQDSMVASETNVTMAEEALAGVSSAYVDASLAYWHETARQSQSCTFNNGGCGVFPCEVDFEAAPPATRCVDPAGELLRLL